MNKWAFWALGAIPLLLTLVRPPPGPPLTWWTTHALDKVRPFDRPPEGLAHNVKISAARNEFEPFQVVLKTEGEDLDGVDVDVTDLHGPSGSIQARKYVSVYLERYLDLKLPSSVAGGTGEWPDPLIPRIDRFTNEKRNAFPFQLVSGRNQPIWIDVFVPPGAVPGMYHGRVEVSAGGKTLISIPLELEVWNFQLPSTSSIATAFGFSGNAALRTHYGRYTNDQSLYDLTYLYQKAALSHRITLDSSPSIGPTLDVSSRGVQIQWDRYDNFLTPFLNGQVFTSDQPLYGAKATSVALHTPHALKNADQQIEFWQQTAEHFRRKQWFDRLFHYVWDEPKPNEFPAMLQLASVVRRADRTVRNLVTAPLHGDWSDVIDIWTPLVNCFERKPGLPEFCTPTVNRSAYDSETRDGKQLWWYQSCGSHGCSVVGGDYFRGWPSYMIDDAPVRNRIMEWLSWKYDIRGELYFSVDEAYSKKTDPWKDVSLYGGNGDGTLFYPGRPQVIGGTTHIPIESIRLKLIREGLEDYEYLVMLTKLKGGKDVADRVNGFIRTTYDYDQDPKKLYAVREWMGHELSR